MQPSASPLRPPVDEVYTARLWHHLERFSSSVRASGSPAEAEAFAYAQQVLDQAGFATRLLRHDAYISLPVRGALRIDGQDIPCITHAMAAHQPEGLRAPLRRATTEADLQGTVALVDGLASPGAVARLQTRGAIGAVFINGAQTYEMIVSPVWGSPTLETGKRLPHIPVVSVAREQASVLEAAAAAGREVDLASEVDTGWRKIPLLEAVLEAPNGNGDFIMFSGHIDAWHLGAMDNGGANATMLEVATLMAERRHELARGLRLLFWSGHSHGRYAGSAWYADNHFELLYDHCLLHVNIDSVGGRGATVLTEAPCMPEAFDLAARAIRDETGVSYVGTRFERAGDQSFWGTGTSSVFMGLSEQAVGDDVASRGFAELFGGGRAGGFGWWWHTKEDTIDKLDPEYLLRDCRIYLRLIHEACAAPVPPLRFARTAAEIREHLGRYAEMAGEELDFNVALRRADKLIEALERLDAHLDAGPDAQAASHLLKAVARILVPLNYVAGRRYEHDPALAQPPVPSLAATRELPEANDETRHVLRVALRRSLNRVELELREVERLVAEALQHDPA